jgi:hypothetical protein
VVQNTFCKILQALVEAPAVQGVGGEAGGPLRKERLKGVAEGGGGGTVGEEDT